MFPSCSFSVEKPASKFEFCVHQSLTAFERHFVLSSNALNLAKNIGFTPKVELRIPGWRDHCFFRNLEDNLVHEIQNALIPKTHTTNHNNILLYILGEGS